MISVCALVPARVRTERLINRPGFGGAADTTDGLLVTEPALFVTLTV
jgi:hypothetical protein